VTFRRGRVHHNQNDSNGSGIDEHKTMTRKKWELEYSDVHNHEIDLEAFRSKTLRR